MSEYRKAIGKHMDDIDQQLELLVREHERVVNVFKKQIEQLEAENKFLKMFQPKNPHTLPDKWEITFTEPVEFALSPDSTMLKFAMKDGYRYTFPDSEFKITLKED